MASSRKFGLKAGVMVVGNGKLVLLDQEVNAVEIAACRHRIVKLE